MYKFKTKGQEKDIPAVEGWDFFLANCSLTQPQSKVGSLLLQYVGTPASTLEIIFIYYWAWVTGPMPLVSSISNRASLSLRPFHVGNTNGVTCMMY